MTLKTEFCHHVLTGRKQSALDFLATFGYDKEAIETKDKSRILDCDIILCLRIAMKQKENTFTIDDYFWDTFQRLVNQLKENTFTNDDDLINEWFDAFDPSIKTFVINFTINKLKPCNVDIAMIENEVEWHLADMLECHLTSFIQPKIINLHIGHLITRCELLS